ncbi:MAG: hypothetical protein LBR34_08140 [Prevotella sp.]|jgi:hypothetical protein|nr:hypothetical protein [Prevotella sp.]
MKSRLTTKILESIPSHIKPITYLMDTLDIGRESAYRRVRGEIPFTFDEVSKLSLDLDFSIDEVINAGKISRTFLDLLTRQPEADVSFTEMFRKYGHIIDHLEENDSAVMIASLNRLPLCLLTTNDTLFKFYYLNYLYQLSGDEAFEKVSFSNMTLPPDVVSLKEKFIAQLMNVHQFMFVISKSLFLTICREIQYFYNRKFISDNDVVILQNALYDLLDTVKKTIQSGTSSFDTRYFFYLSYMDISANSACLTCGDDVVAQFWIYGSNFIEVRNQEVCYMYKEWFEYLKKYTVMISTSNEMFQIKFFDLQRSYIENITKEFSYFE